jgi:hypothetical protein
MLRSLPFTADALYAVLETYNSAIWPAQVAAYVLGVALLALALRPVAAGGRIILAVLSAFWLWIGIVFHLLFFFQINFLAIGFGALFVIQGILFAASALVGRRSFAFRADAFGWSGLFLAVFALAVYPLVAWLAGHGWPRMQVFGVTPTPTVIFSFGMLLMAERRSPLLLAALPLLWAFIGGSAVFLLGSITEDLCLLLAGVAAFGLLVWKRGRAD